MWKRRWKTGFEADGIGVCGRLHKFLFKRCKSLAVSSLAVFRAPVSAARPGLGIKSFPQKTRVASKPVHEALCLPPFSRLADRREAAGAARGDARDRRAPLEAASEEAVPPRRWGAAGAAAELSTEIVEKAVEKPLKTGREPALYRHLSRLHRNLCRNG